MCITAFAGYMSEYRLLRRELKYLRNLDVGFVPFED